MCCSKNQLVRILKSNRLIILSIVKIRHLEHSVSLWPSTTAYWFSRHLASRPLCRIPVIPTQHDCQARSERSLRIDCSVEFSGNVRPIIECRNSERRILEREKISSSEISDSRVVLYSFISKVDFQTNKQTILCKTSVSHIPGNTMEIQIPSCRH